MRKVIRKKVTPWQRWVIIVTLIAHDKQQACKRLQLSQRQHTELLANALATLGVNTLTHAALRLNLLKVNYDDLGEWVDKNPVELSPGVIVNIDGDDND
jgi:hypothetical protein